MAAADHQVNPPVEEDEDVILLTEVVAEPPREVVLEISPGGSELDSLLGKDLPAPAAPETSPAAKANDDLNDLLASLKDLPEDLGAPAKAPGEGGVLRGKPEMAGREELRWSLTETQLRDLVREVAQETVEKLLRELAPQVTAQVLDGKINAWRRRVAEEE